MGMIKHSRSIESSKFAISLQYLKKEVRDGAHFLHAVKHQFPHKLVLLFLLEVARHVQFTQSRKLLIFLQGLVMQKMSNCYSDAKHSDILQKSSQVHCYLFFFSACNVLGYGRWGSIQAHPERSL